LFKKLNQLDGTIPMHMPGHKRNTALTGKDGYLEKFGAFADITEIEGFDNLNSPNGLFIESMQKAARLWHSEETLFSVNGGTGGILASIFGSISGGGKVILARNCHVSVYNALEIRDAETVYTIPIQNSETGIWGAADAFDLELLLEKHPDTQLVIVTSPTYEGAVSDIRHISNVCHKKNVPLMVDEAHGCHFGFGYGFPESAVTCGADIVVQSIHKTLAGLTQTALIHLNGSLIDRQKIKRALTIFQSSSPSYLLSASIDGCVRLLENHGSELFENWQRNLDRFYMQTSNFKHLKFMKEQSGSFIFDRSKIVIMTNETVITGIELANILRKQYKIELEMASLAYAVAMTGIGDTWNNLHLLSNALSEIDRKCSFKKQDLLFPEFILPEKVLKASEAEAHIKTAVPLESAVRQICGEYVMAYPPGVPLIVPGERINEYEIHTVEKYKSCGIKVTSTYSCFPEKIFVIKSTQLLNKS